MAKYVIEIPRWHPQTVNQLYGTHQHWGYKRKQKKLDRAMVTHYVGQAKVPPQERKRRVTLTIVLAPKKRGADVDAYWKSCLDALVGCSALAGDSSKWVELAPVQYERAEAWGCKIELLDL
ncbi:MAG: hypothetical protein K8U57_37090 [Planctomycetes bacterium]|nr:hypothetical protein [Planctomycetota bacterium]